MERFTESRYIPCTIGLATKRLTSISKAVHEIREEEIKLHQHRIHREDYSPTTGTGRSEEEIYGNEAERTQEDIAVDVEKAPHRFTDKRSPKHQVATQAAIIAQKQTQSHDETSILCYHRTPGHTLDLHAKAID